MQDGSFLPPLLLLEEMPRWEIHKKWCKILGIEESICQEVNRIVDRPPHDIEDQLFRKGWARILFKSGQATTRIHINPGDEIDQLTTELAEITNRFGEEGIKATFNHLALDYIAELIELGYRKEEIRKKLAERELMNYLPDYDQIFDDISRETEHGIKAAKREEFEKIVKYRLNGVFMVNSSSSPLSPVPALLHIKSELKKGRTVRVKWGIDTYDARRGGISRTLHEMEDLEELISEITGKKKI